MEQKFLYGDNMSVQLPPNINDVSQVREVPDNQEVFTHSHTDQSIIVEVLEYVQEADEQALKTHFDDLASSNSTSGNDSVIQSVDVVPQENISMQECQAAYFLHGQQHVAKFNESAKNMVNVYMGLFRLADHETDILVTFNDPANIHPDSSSYGPVSVATEPWNVEQFHLVLQSLKILDVSFLG